MSDNPQEQPGVPEPETQAVTEPETTEDIVARSLKKGPVNTGEEGAENTKANPVSMFISILVIVVLVAGGYGLYNKYGEVLGSKGAGAVLNNEETPEIVAPATSISFVSEVKGGELKTPDSFKAIPGGFTFAAGEKRKSTTRTVDMFLDFGGKKSMGTMYSNVPFLGGATQNYDLVLSIHPVISDDPNSELGARAMAAFAASDKNVYQWAFFSDLVSFMNRSGGMKEEDIRNNIDHLSIIHGGPEKLDLDSVDDLVEYLKKTNNAVVADKIPGNYVPSVFVDGKIVDRTQYTISDPDQLFAAIYGNTPPERTNNAL